MLDGNCHGGLLHALDDGLVECAVALDIALEDIKGDGDFIEFQRGGLLLLEGCAEFGLGLDGGFVLSIQNVAGLADILVQGLFQGINAGGCGDVFRMQGTIAVLHGGELGFGIEETATMLGDLGNLGNAGDAQELIDILRASGANLLDIGFQPQALSLGAGDLGAEFAEALDDDVLTLLQRDGLVLLLVALEFCFGLFELFFQLFRFLLEELRGHAVHRGPLAEIFTHEFLHDGCRQVACHDGIGVLDGDIDEARASTQGDLHFATELVGELNFGGRIGVVGIHECRVLAKLVGVDDAQHEVPAGEGLDNGVDEVLRGGILLDDAVNFDDLLFLLLDLEHGTGFVDFRLAHDPSRGSYHGDADKKNNDPPAGQKDKKHAPEVHRAAKLLEDLARARWLIQVLCLAVRRGFHFDLKERLPDGNDITRLDEQSGRIIAAKHALGIEFENLLATVFNALDGHIRSVSDLGVAPGHADGLKKGDLAGANDVVGTRPLHLAQNREKFFGIGTHREADLGVDEIPVAVSGF